MKRENKNVEDIFDQKFLDDIIVEENSEEDMESQATTHRKMLEKNDHNHLFDITSSNAASRVVTPKEAPKKSSVNLKSDESGSINFDEYNTKSRESSDENKSTS